MSQDHNLRDRLELQISEGFARIEHMLGRLIRLNIREHDMDRALVDRLIKSTTANTDAVKAASEALTTYAQSNVDLTAKLQTAIAAAGDDVSPDITAAADALDANNKVLLDAVPKVATAVVANTPAATV